MIVLKRDFQERPTPPPERLRAVVETARERLAAPDGVVAFAFVNDARMKSEHQRFLGDPTTTDVLSFPAHETEPGVGGDDETADGPYWGDVIICTDQAQRQARELAHPYGYELIVLALHGTLHLLGLDHTRAGSRMRGLEEELRPRCVAGWYM